MSRFTGGKTCDQLRAQCVPLPRHCCCVLFALLDKSALLSALSCSFLLRDLKAKAAFECEESWAGPTLCTLDIPGLTPDGGFQSYCAAAECRLH